MKRFVVHQLHLPGSAIDGDPVNCTGPQLASIIEACAAVGPFVDCVWYAAGVEAIGPNQTRLQPYSTDDARLVGGTDELIEFTRAYYQFIAGLFILVSEPMRPEILARGSDIEGGAFQFSRSEAEIEPFDTTFIEIVTRNDQIASALSKRFAGR